jgi:hypothetical protein
VRKRPLSVWKELQYILSVQNVCHVGEPDYENLYAFQASSRMKLGSLYMHINLYMYTYMYMYIYIYIHMYTHIYIYIYIYENLYAF